MKKLILSLLAVAVMLSANAQSGYINQSYTYTGAGTYSAEWNANITIANGANITISELKVDGGSVTIKTGGTLTVTKLKTTFNAHLFIESNGVFTLNDDATFNSGALILGTLHSNNEINISNAGFLLGGTLTSSTLDLNNVGDIIMGGCAFVSTSQLNNQAGTDYNLAAINGSGLVVATTLYSPNALTYNDSIRLTTSSKSGKNVNYGNATPSTQTTAPCATLTPVKWASFSLIRSNPDSTNLTVSWQTLTESNVKSYTLQGSADGGITWDNLTSINPNNNGNSPTSQNYSITYTDPLVATIIEAGFGLLGSLLIIGMIVGMVSKKHKVIGGICAVLAIVCMVSCTKSNVIATPKHLKYKMFRVVETDLDGTATYSIVMVG